MKLVAGQTEKCKFSEDGSCSACVEIWTGNQERKQFTVVSQLISFKHKTSVIMLFNDTTEVKLSEEIKAKEKYLHVLLASVCHELRTPLNSISANVNLVSRDKGASVNVKDKMKVVQNNVSFTLSMIDDIIDIARLDKGMFQLKMEDF